MPFNLNAAPIQGWFVSVLPSSPLLPSLHCRMVGWRCQFIYNDLGPFLSAYPPSLLPPRGPKAKLFHSVCNNLGAILNKMAESLELQTELASVEKRRREPCLCLWYTTWTLYYNMNHCGWFIVKSWRVVRQLSLQRWLIIVIFVFLRS